MTRKKVKLAYIANDSARKATLKKRKKGLMKKVSELSTLCDVQACAVIYSPFEPQPEVWPSAMAVHRVIDQFKSMPEVDQGKKMMNQESFLKNMITKMTDQLRKICRDNREKEMQQVMFHSMITQNLPHNISLVDLYDVQWVIEHHLREIGKALTNINENVNNYNDTPPQQNEATMSPLAGIASESTILPPLPISLPQPQQEEVMEGTVGQELMDRQHSFTELLMNQQQENGGFGAHELNLTMVPWGVNNSMWFNNYHG